MATGGRKPKKADDGIEAAEAAKWVTALEGAPFPAALWCGAQLQFRWANKRFLELLWESQSRFDLLGMPVRGFLSDTEMAVRFQDVAYTGQPYTERAYRYVGPSGEVTWWQLSLLPVPAGLGDPSDVLVTAVDVTTDVAARADEERRRADMASAEGLIQRTILSTLDAEEILQRALVDATEAYGADWGWIALRECDTWVFRNVHGWPEGMIGRAFREDELSLPRLAADARAVVMAGSPGEAGEAGAQLMERFDVGAFLLVPLYAKGEVRGVMGFCWNDPYPLTEAHRELADKLSLSLTLALENARAYGDERYIARTLQSAFFHVPHKVAGLEFGHLYHAAEVGARVGGDFYDIIEPQPGSVGVLIGDVSGHGVGVSALASLVKSAMHVQALTAPSPRRILSTTNELVVRSAIEERYASAFFGLLDMPTGAFSYCSAGHPQPVLARPGAAAAMLPEAQMVLGVASNVPYANDRAVLEVGDLLVLYTDGLVEARSSSGEAYGYRRLLAAVQGLAEEPAAKVPESLFLDAFSFSDGRVEDDIAILALRRTEEAAFTGQDRLALEVA